MIVIAGSWRWCKRGQKKRHLEPLSRTPAGSTSTLLLELGWRNGERRWNEVTFRSSLMLVEISSSPLPLVLLLLFWLNSLVLSSDTSSLPSSSSSPYFIFTRKDDDENWSLLYFPIVRIYLFPVQKVFSLSPRLRFPSFHMVAFHLLLSLSPEWCRVLRKHQSGIRTLSHRVLEIVILISNRDNHSASDDDDDVFGSCYQGKREEIRLNQSLTMDFCFRKEESGNQQEGGEKISFCLNVWLTLLTANY